MLWGHRGEGDRCPTLPSFLEERTPELGSPGFQGGIPGRTESLGGGTVREAGLGTWGGYLGWCHRSWRSALQRRQLS